MESNLSDQLQKLEVTWRDLSIELATREFGRTPQQMDGNHQSIIDVNVGSSSLVSSLSAPCPLCPLDKFMFSTPKDIKRHLVRFHESHSFSCSGKKFLICRLACMEHRRSHYHCVCGRMTRLRSTAEHHVKKCPCFSEVAEPLDLVDDTVPSSVNHTPELPSLANPVPCNDSNAVHPEVAIDPPDEGRKLATTQCYVCQKKVSKKNVRRHLKTHQKEPSKDPSCCVDKAGLFLVEKHTGSGPVRPLHVKVKTHGNNQGMTCTDERCQEIMAPAARGKQNFVCQHLGRAINSSSFVEESLYPPIEQASLSTTMKVQVQNLKSKADQHQSPLVVKWPYSVSPTFYSVYTGNVKQWCQLGRVLLTVTEDTINCPCVGSTHNCVHKASVRWVMQCKQKADAVTPEDDVSLTGDCPNVSKETIAKRTRDWIEYLCKKRYDPESFVDFDASVEFTSLIPSENDCPWCNKALTVKLSTDKGVVVDYQFTRKDIKVYKKDCQRCGNFVYYHDPSHGLHNYKNKIFLTMRFCRWIRCCIQTHTALGRELDKLQLFNKLSYPPHNEIMKAYLSYEALCAHDYEFICLECGIFPPVLVTDVDKKCCFKLNLADVGGQEDVTDTVCQDSFWDRVDMQIMSAASSDDASTEHVVPSYNNWSPYVGAAKSDQMVYNTEFKKLPASSRPTNHDEEMELELTEDLLIELMSEKKHTHQERITAIIVNPHKI